MQVIYEVAKALPTTEVCSLYSDAGWTNYTKNLELLTLGMANSYKVVTAWHNNHLVGLARAVGDGCTILYVQDLLVLSSYQRNGIGSELLRRLLDGEVARQKVLLTDAHNPAAHILYQKFGFVPAISKDTVAFLVD